MGFQRRQSEIKSGELKIKLYIPLSVDVTGLSSSSTQEEDASTFPSSTTISLSIC